MYKSIYTKSTTFPHPYHFCGKTRWQSALPIVWGLAIVQFLEHRSPTQLTWSNTASAKPSKIVEPFLPRETLQKQKYLTSDSILDLTTDVSSAHPQLVSRPPVRPPDSERPPEKRPPPKLIIKPLLKGVDGNETRLFFKLGFGRFVEICVSRGLSCYFLALVVTFPWNPRRKAQVRQKVSCCC